MRLSVTVDASVLAAPSEDEGTRDHILRYVEGLLDWQRLLDESWIPIHMGERAAEVLFKDDLFPSYPTLRDTFAINGIVEYSPNDIVQVATSLLQLTPTFEKRFKLSDVLVSELTTDPDVVSEHECTNLGAELQRCLVFAALLEHCCEEPLLRHTLVLKTRSEISETFLSAELIELEHDREDITHIPSRLQGTVPVCRSFKGLMANVDEMSLWLVAAGEEEARKVIQVALYKARLERRLEPEWNQVPSFTFGPRFLESCHRAVNSGSGQLVTKLLRALTRTLLNVDLQDVHALRETAGGNAPQRIRNGDKAWRRDIDYQYHLHYWEQPEGTIEFASVGPHDDFSIPH